MISSLRILFELHASGIQLCVHGPDLMMTTKFCQENYKLLIYSFVFKIRIQTYYIYSILSVFFNPKVFFD